MLVIQYIVHSPRARVGRRVVSEHTERPVRRVHVTQLTLEHCKETILASYDMNFSKFLHVKKGLGAHIQLVFSPINLLFNAEMSLSNKKKTFFNQK